MSRPTHLSLLALAVAFLSSNAGCDRTANQANADAGVQDEFGFKGAKSKKKKKGAHGEEAEETVDDLDGKEFVADLGFRPKPNGFGFPNYSLQPDQNPLGPKDLRKMCGDKAVCAGDGDDEECTLKAGAAAFLDRTSKLLGGGHCEGFSVGALRLHFKEDDLDSLGANQAFDLEKKKKVERYIAYWAVTQLSPSVAKATVRAQPNKILSMLITSMKKKSESYVLGIYRADGMGGHAIAPYAVEDRGDDIYWVYVYENNSPAKLRHVEFDKSKNTWRYDDAATNPDDTPSTYGGDEDSPRIELIPQSARNSMACPFATGTSAPGKAKPAPEVDDDDDDEDEDEAPKAKKKKKKPVEEPSELAEEEDDDVMVVPGGRGESKLSVQDEAGHTLGVKDGKLVNEIPGATYIIMRGKLSSNMGPVLVFPAKTKVTLSVRGTDGQQDDIVIIGKKFSATMTGVALKPAPTEGVEIDGKGKKLSFTGGAPTAQNIDLTFDKGKTVKTMHLPKLAPMQAGEKLTINTKKGLVAINNKGKLAPIAAPLTVVLKPVKGMKFEPIAPGANAGKPLDAKPLDAKPLDAKPLDAKGLEGKPSLKPLEANPNAANPNAAKPNEAKPVDPKIAPKLTPIEAKPGVTPAPAKPDAVKPAAPDAPKAPPKMTPLEAAPPKAGPPKPAPILKPLAPKK